jgi:hypothetical protein
MTTAGQVWKQKIQEKTNRAEVKTVEDDALRAQRIIDSVPGKIDEAFAKNLTSIRLSEGWVSGSEVSCGNVEALADGPERGKPLTADDFKGYLKTVVAWCLNNDLECFLVSEKVPLNDYEYHLEARLAR